MPPATLDLLRFLLARDAAILPAASRWDAAAWAVVQRAVTAWDAAPIAYASARSAKLLPHVPPALVESWRRDHTGTTAVNMRLAFESAALVKALAKSGARGAPLKGTALFARGVWRDPGARPTCDIDLLIDPEQGAIVHRVLLDRGYVQTRAGGSKHWPPYVRDGLVVEVHEHAFWSLADGHRVGLAEALDPKGEVSIAVTVAHLVHHLFESSVTTPWLVVKTLADLAEARALTIDDRRLADEIALKSRQFGLGRRLSALAGLLARALHCPVPAGWVADVVPDDIDALLWRAAPETGPRVDALRILDRTASFSRMPRREKIAILRHYLLPPPEMMRADYGLSERSPWVWPLYVLRPFHLAGRSAADAVHLLARERPEKG